MQIPRFLEANHPLVQPLAQTSDQDLLTLLQRYPDRGRYFTALLCRYTPLVYTLVSHATKSPVQADYLFAQIWRHLFYELSGLDLRAYEVAGTPLSLQSWLLKLTAQCINQAHLPPVEAIHYNLKAAPPALWCYVERALEQLPPPLRLVTIMAQTYHWSETRIAAYLQAEGERISPAEVKSQIQEAYQQLEVLLPKDLRTIYFDEPFNEDEEEGLGELADLSQILG